jgi:hypothetical protein
VGWQRRFGVALIAGLLVAVATVSITTAGPATQAAAQVAPLSTVPQGTAVDKITTAASGVVFPRTGQLDFYGYVEEEYFIAGRARSYVNDGPITENGEWSITPREEAPYITRVVVRRPADPAAFNGTVVFEWLNVTAGYDNDPGWLLVDQEYLRQGSVWVGVSAQYQGHPLLRLLNNETYARLYHPGDTWSYDIFAQVANTVVNPLQGQPWPLEGLTPRVERTIATGHSQSAWRLWTYYNAMHPVDQFFDGFLIAGMERAAPISQPNPIGVWENPPTEDDINNGAPPLVSVPQVGGTIRTDVETPVIVLNTESESGRIAAVQSIHLQPDAEYLRVWEVAGASHAEAAFVFGFLECGDLPANNEGPHRYAKRAAVRALDEWIRTGTPAPTANRQNISVANTPFGPVAVVDRNPWTGISTGGIRLPQVLIPSGTLRGDRPVAYEADYPFCGLFGSWDAWNDDADSYDGTEFDGSPSPEPSMTAIYGTPESYRAWFGLGVWIAIQQGFLLPEDAWILLAEAAEVDFGNPPPPDPAPDPDPTPAPDPDPGAG